MDYIKVNGHEIPYPNSLEMTKEPNIVDEFIALNGQKIVDINGWRYADTELQWDYLYDEDLQKLLLETDPKYQPHGTFDFEFLDPQENRKTIVAIRNSVSSVKTPMRDRYGNRVWTDLKISLTFPDCYT